MTHVAPIDRASSPSPWRSGRWLRAGVYLLLAVYFLLGAGYLTLRYHVWPNLDQWRPQIVAEISALLGRPITVSRLETGFEGWSPVITVHNIKLAPLPQPGQAQSEAGSGDSSDGLLELPEVRAVIALRSFLTGRVRLRELQVLRPSAAVERRRDGSWLIGGMAVPLSGGEDSGLLEELLAHRNIRIRGATFRWQDHVLGRSHHFEGIDLELHNLGRLHRLHLRALRMDELARDVEASAELYRPPGRRFSDWAAWFGDLYLAGSAINADKVAESLGLSLPFAGATMQLRAWSRLDQLRLNDVQVKLAGSDLRLELPDAGPIELSRFGGEGTAVRRKNGGFDLVVRSLYGHTDTGMALRAVGNQELAVDADGAIRSARIAIEDIDLAGALALARRIPWAVRQYPGLANLRLRGQVVGLKAVLVRNEQLEFDASMRFDRFSLLAPSPAANESAPGGVVGAGLPSIENVSGNARITHLGGSMSFEGRQSALTLPGLFEEPRFLLDRMTGKVAWQKPAHPGAALVVDIESLDFANSDAAGSLSGRYHFSEHSLGVADLRGGLTRGNVTRVARYLPVLLPEHVRHWVRDSITAGRINNARYVLRGDLQKFPFRDPAEGEFTIEGTVTDGTLAYAPGWPQIEQFDGLLRFAAAGMDIRMNRGRLFGVQMTETQSKIVDFKDPLLIIEGKGTGPAKDMLRFVNDSPVSTRINDFTRETQASGDAQLALRIELPLADLVHSKVKGRVTFDRNNIVLDSTIPKFDGVSGHLHFSETGLGLQGISATFLGGPITVEGTTPEPGRLLIQAQGNLSAENIRGVIDNPLTQQLGGRANYKALVDVFKRSARITVESDLVGLSANLPEPFNKPADAAWPLRTVSLPIGAPAGERGTGDLIETTIRDRVKLVFERGRNPVTQKLQIRRGAFAYDAQPALTDQGFVVLVNRSDIDVDRWLDILTGPAMQAAAARPTDEFAEGFTMLPSLVSLVSDRITIGGKELHEVVFGASRQGGFWRANISAREINGYFNWSEAREGQRIGALTARFSRLELPSSKRSEIESLLESAPRELPSLDIWADELILSERSLGRMSLKASSGGTADLPSWQLNSLRIENPAATLHASGVWAPPSAGEKRNTRLEYRLEMVDAGGLLSRYGMQEVVKGAAGTLRGSLAWEGSPLALHFPSLTGYTRVDIGKGQFLKTDPGIGKLIGVLNMQYLARRLALDFSDVFADGFSFDAIEGDLAINRGIARTDDLLMKGVQARVRMKGQVDLERETQVVDVEVKPELNAGLASLAYAALANPAVGLTTFIAQSLLRRPLEEIFTYHYDVTGSWSDPQVKERRANRQSPPVLLP